MPMLDLPNIKIEDRHRYCRVTMRPSFDDAGYFVDFTPEETRQIEAALHEYNQRQKAVRLPEIYRTRFPRLDALDLDRVALDRPRPSGKFAECVGAEWRQTKYGHRLRLMVQFATAESGGTREYWPPPGSVRILFRVHGSDLILWPDRFDLPLTIARDVMNPTTKVRSDRVWVAPADLWPCAQVDGGASLGSNQ